MSGAAGYTACSDNKSDNTILAARINVALVAVLLGLLISLFFLYSDGSYHGKSGHIQLKLIY